MTSRPPSLPPSPDGPESLTLRSLKVGDRVRLSSEDDGASEFEVRQIDPCWLLCVQAPVPYLHHKWLFLSDGMLRTGEGYVLLDQAGAQAGFLNRVTAIQPLSSRTVSPPATTLVADEEGGDPSHTQMLRAKGINVRSNRNRH